MTNTPTHIMEASTTKVCSQCGEAQPRERFYARKDSRDGLYGKCIGCKNTQRLNYPFISSKAPHEHAADKRAARAANPDAHRAASKKWKAKNPDKVRVHKINRGARERSERAESISQQQLQDRLEQFGGGCAYCPEVATEWDHYVPLAKRGRHVIDNLVPACGPCNRSKYQRLPIFEWMAA